MIPEIKSILKVRWTEDQGLLPTQRIRAFLLLELLPGDRGSIPQEALNFLSASLLVLRVGGQSIENPGNSTGCSVMTLKHECVHLCTQVLIRQAVPILHLNEYTGERTEFVSHLCLWAKSQPCTQLTLANKRMSKKSKCLFFLAFCSSSSFCS